MLDGTGQHGLRATGQVVIFPGFLSLYEEGHDDAEDEDAKLLPRMARATRPRRRR
jgi:DNA topoisomerase-1